MRKGFFVVGRFLVVAAALVIGAATASAETVLRFVSYSDLRIIDPIFSNGYAERNHGYMIYDTLFAFDSKYQVKPQMVDTWTVSADQLTWDFKLRAGLKWHDGTPVRGADCVASLQRWAKRDPLGGAMFSQLKSIEATGEDSFRITLNKPFAQLLEALAKLGVPVPFMMPERIAQTDPFKGITEAIGSGPFMFVKEEWKPGNQAIYKKNPSYMPRSEPADYYAGGKVAKVDKIEWLYIPDPATAISALSAGEVDWIERPSVDLLPVLERNKDVVIRPLDPFGYHLMLRFNHLHPPFNDERARRAAILMIDQNELMKVVSDDPQTAIKCRSFFLCGTRYGADVLPASSTLLMRKHTDEAKKLLAESGYKGEKLKFIDAVDIHPDHELIQILMKNLTEAGFNIELLPTDAASLFTVASKQEPGAWNMTHFFADSTASAEPYLANGLRAGGPGKASAGWPKSDKIEALRAEFLLADSPDKQKAVADNLQKAAYEHSLYGIVGQFRPATAYRKNVSNLINAPAPLFWGVEKK